MGNRARLGHAGHVGRTVSEPQARGLCFSCVLERPCRSGPTHCELADRVTQRNVRCRMSKMWEAPAPGRFLPKSRMQNRHAWYHKFLSRVTFSRLATFGGYQNARERSTHRDCGSGSRVVVFRGDSDGEAVRPYPARGPKASLRIYRHGLARAPAKRSARGRFWGKGIPKPVPSAGCQLAKSF